MSQTDCRPKILSSKIYYLKQRNKSCPDPHVLKPKVLTVHLSSALQSDHRHALNKEMVAFTRRLESSQLSNRLWVAECPLTHKGIRKDKVQLKRQIHSSHEIKHRKLDDPNTFFLSQIVDQKQTRQKIEPSKRLFEKEHVPRSKSKRKNYILRKMEFKTFLRERQEKNREKPAAKQPKQVVYEKEELNDWQIDLKLGDEFYARFHPIRKRLCQGQKQSAKNKLQCLQLHQNLFHSQ